jgi:type I restriction enzyme, S subunit
MIKWNKVKIGDVCIIEKGTTGLAKANPGIYPLVATGADRKTSSDYQFDAKAVCIPLVSSTGHGKKTLNYVHYQEGKFALGSILAAIIPKDENIINARYLQVYLQKNKNRVLVPLMKGAANVSLAIKDIANIEIPAPPRIEQEIILTKIDRISENHKRFLNETDIQLSLFEKLRQSVLKEAIEGKLTEKWRKQNPELISGNHSASNLLEKIKTEKERLTKEGKIKKEKPLPLITDKEKLFDLPEGWTWCRLANIGVINPRNNIDDNLEVSFSPMALISNEYGMHPSFEIKKWGVIKNGFTHFADNDVAIAKITPCFENSKACVFKGLVNGYGAGTTELHVLRPIIINPEFLYIFVKTPAFLRSGEAQMTGVCGQKRVPLDYFSNAILPLPPSAEQQVIVDRVDKLMSMINELEKQVTERKDLSDKLMQAVLKEAFEEKDK